MIRKLSSLLAFGVLALSFYASEVAGQTAVLWEPVNVKQKDLFNGPGGTALRPNTRKITFIEKETSGNNLKYRIKDGSGRIWVAKIADESRPETAAVRLLWAIGYKTEINYLVPRLTIPTKGTYNNVRLEARPANVTRGERWGWNDNPFVGTRELKGLKIMMAMINNWDIKNDNTAILNVGDERHYIISDLGSSFGKLAYSSGFLVNRFGRSVDRPAQYARSKFINGIDKEGFIDLAYNSKHSGVMDDLTVEDAEWLGGLLGQLSNKQLNDAFRAANYNASERRILTNAFRARIRELQRFGSGRAIAVR
ncbi:MAG TPA: hypothetical protein VFZ49_10990 [Pyrinomonadaceae bacterium]